MSLPTLPKFVLICLALVVVANQAGAQTSCPAVTNYFPRIGYPGYGLTILGQNLTGVSEVKFNGGVSALFEIRSDTEIAVTIPLNAQSGPIAISKPGCADAATDIFSIPPPAEISVTPELQILTPGKTGQLTVNFKNGLLVPATISIESSNPSGISVPSWAVIPMGTTSTSFRIEAISPGAVAAITVSLPSNLGGGRAIAMVSVESPIVRPVRFPPVRAKAGAALFVPIHLSVQGDENAVRFSLAYDSSVLGNPQAYLGMSLGSGTVRVDRSQAEHGRAGFALELPTGETIPPGDKQILMLRFDIAEAAAGGVASLGFSDLPLARGIYGITGDLLLSTFTPAEAIVEAAQVDLALSPQSQIVTAGGSAQMSVRIKNPATGPIKVSLASSQPEAVQVPASVTIPQGSNFAVFSILGATAGSAATITASLPADLGGASTTATVQVIAPVTRNVKIPGATGRPGGTMSIPIEINAQGDENEIGFSLSFDPKILGDPRVSLGMSLGSGTITLFSEQMAEGRLGIVLSFPQGEPVPAGNKQILMLRFAIALDAPAGETRFSFIDQPAMRKIISAGGAILPASFLSGPVMIER